MKKLKRKPKPAVGTIIGAEVIKVDREFILFNKKVIGDIDDRPYLKGYNWILFNYKKGKVVELYLSVLTCMTEGVKEPELEEGYYSNMVNEINKSIKKK